jgi:c-di-AMP phosphodiesterase-like protein
LDGPFSLSVDLSKNCREANPPISGVLFSKPKDSYKVFVFRFRPLGYNNKVMTKTLSKLKVAAFILFLFELVGIAVVSVLWFFNFGGFQTIDNVLYILVGLIVFTVTDTLFIWFSLLHINKLRQKNDVEAARLVGSDVQEAYDFGQIGLVVVDESNVIMWANTLFKDRQIDLIDTQVFEWLPALKDLVNAPVNKIVKVEIKGRQYDVKYISEPRLFIFKDTTEYENVVNYSEEHAVVLGIIQIDNFKEIASETDESADVVNKIRSLIADYCRDNGVLLRWVRTDTYFSVCDYGSLKKMEDDKFSILETVRQAGSKLDNPLTLSLGFAHDFPDVSKLNEMATNALDVALSRGGDQAVVSQYGAELRFFGGKTAAVETTSKVKVRSVADSIVSLIKSSSNVFVMGHQDMDMDSLGAALGIVAICDWCNKPSKIVYNAKLAEKKTKMAFQSAFSRDVFDKMTILPDDAVAALKDSTLVIIVDISVPDMVMAPKLLEKAAKVIVIDHHRRSDKYVDHPVLAYIEPSASSASELVAEMIRYATANPRIELKPTFATLMLSGIFLDSSYFKSKSTGMRTFEAAEILKEYGADNSVADDYLKDEFEEYSLITKIIATMQTPHYGIVYCTCDDKDIIERSTLAKVANQVMQLKDINACFVIGKTDEKNVRLSARSDGTINVQLLCEKMGGGGHFTMAASIFPGQSVDRVVNTLTTTLDEYLDSARASVDTTGGGGKI